MSGSNTLCACVSGLATAYQPTEPATQRMHCLAAVLLAVAVILWMGVLRLHPHVDAPTVADVGCRRMHRSQDLVNVGQPWMCL